MKFRGFHVCKFSRRLRRALFLLSVGLLTSLGVSALAQQCAVAQTPQVSQPKSTETGLAADEQPPGEELGGTISGTIVDGTEALISGAHIKLSREGGPDQDLVSDDDGQFSVSNVTPGLFQLTIVRGLRADDLLGDPEFGRELRRSADHAHRRQQCDKCAGLHVPERTRRGGD